MSAVKNNIDVAEGAERQLYKGKGILDFIHILHILKHEPLILENGTKCVSVKCRPILACVVRTDLSGTTHSDKLDFR